MSRKCIAIEYDGNYCHAVQVKSFRNSLIIEKTLTINDFNPDTLKIELVDAGFNLNIPAVLVMPPDKCHFTNIDSNADSVVPADETDSLSPPVHLEDAVRIHLPNEHKLPGCQPTRLVITTNKSEIERIAKFAENNQIKCSAIILPVFALYAAAKANIDDNEPQQMTVFFSDKRLIISAFINNEIALVRNLPLPEIQSLPDDIIISETKLTWRATFGEQVPDKAPIAILNATNSNGDVIHGIRDNIGGKNIIVDINSIGSFEAHPDKPGRFLMAVGAAALTLNPDKYPDLNLLKSLRKSQNEKPDKPQLLITTILLALLFSLLLASSIREFLSLNNTHNNIIKQIDSVFIENMPELADKSSQMVPKIKLAVMKDTFANSGLLTEQLQNSFQKKLPILTIFNLLAEDHDPSVNFTVLELENNILNAIVASPDINQLHKITEKLNNSNYFKIIKADSGTTKEQKTLNLQLQIIYH